MGRWLAALKKHENAEIENRQNPQKSPEPIFVGFVGAASAHTQNNPDAPEAFLSVLSVPVSGESKNSQLDLDAVEERAAILEYDDGLHRAEAERQVAAEIGYSAPPKPDADLYADALRQIGPCGYGPVAVFLGWGAGRASAAEIELRQADRIVYDRTGRGRPAE
ncbi:MAG: hypothetical protein J0I98_03875 [Mesorhizobium sp.]|nr:hypothetical protein [Mesorhizobium sp.]MBN9241911.1 hypothetical protein [Mesorhizobium sp.]